ncbi:MAG: DUF4116 domain-containing protein [Prevotellaceae bacterium]|jgi:hypothetical protein|nr:DUF4116 domain-containing protein [Prevotellaceae bacterium]
METNNIVTVIAAVKENGLALEFVKEQTPEICMEAVKQNGWALKYVKEQTPEMCMEAVKESGFALDYVKEQTPEICMEAVKQNGLALHYVKEQTPEIDMAAVKESGFALDYVKEQTPEICMEAVKQNGWALKYVKEQTPEMCMEAVKENGLALKHVKERTPEICMEAVKQDGLALEFVKEQTPEMCMEAVKQNGLALKLIKEQTPEITITAAGFFAITPEQRANIPEHSVIKGDLDLGIGTKYPLPADLSRLKLPENLTIEGNLDISGSNVESFPTLRELPRNLTIKGNLEGELSNIKSLPEGLRVFGNVNLKNSNVETLGENIVIHGKLDLQGSKIDNGSALELIKNMETNSISSNIPTKIGNAFPLDSNITGKRTFNVGLDIEELNKVTPDEKGKVKLEVRSFYNKQTNKPFFTVATPNGLDEHFIVATMEIDKSALLKNVLPSSEQKHVNFMLTEDKAGKATAYMPAMTKEHAALYQNAAHSFKSPEINSKEITNKYKELLQEAGLPYNDIVGRGDIGESWGFARPIPTKIGNIELTHEQRNALRDGKTLELSGLKSKTGEEYKTAYVKLDPKTKTVKLLQNKSEKEKTVVQKQDIPAKKSRGMKM